MHRHELFQLAKKHQKGPKKELDRGSIRDELIAYFQSEKGQKAIKKAPRITLEITPDLIHDPVPDQPIDVIVDMILQEWS